MSEFGFRHWLGGLGVEGKEEGADSFARASLSFMLGLAANPEMVRNVVIVGHLHHGKTSLVDMLVHETHKIDLDTDRPVRIFPFCLSALPR